MLVLFVALGACATLPDVRTIRINADKVAYVGAGQGGPVVVLESGMGPTMETWSPVFDDLAQLSTVVAYDRPGYGRSRSPHPPKSPSDVARKLHALLIETGHEPPYIVVGHSAGGLYANAFARLFPDDTAGIVFLDATHPMWFEHLEEDHPLLAGSLIASTTIGRFGARRYEANIVQNTRADFDSLPDFPDVPLVVLTSSRASMLASDKMQDKWNEFQRDLATLSPRSTHSVVANSGHYIHKDRPDAVVEAIEAIISSSYQ